MLSFLARQTISFQTASSADAEVRKPGDPLCIGAENLNTRKIIENVPEKQEEEKQCEVINFVTIIIDK